MVRPRLCFLPVFVVGIGACAPIPPRADPPAPARPESTTDRSPRAEPPAANLPAEPPAESPAPIGVWDPADAAGDGDADWLATTHLLVPVRGVRTTSIEDSFDAPRDGGRHHDAVDIMAARGTPVLATVDGTILRVGKNELGGNVVWMADMARRFAFYYAHLDRHARGIHVGDDVRRGTVLGFVGTTGNAPPNTPHLHFQVMRTPDPSKWWNGTPVDPVPFLTDAIRLPAPGRGRRP